MKIDEARLYLEHTSRDDFNLEEHQIENRYEAIKVVLEEIERLHSIIKEVREYIEKPVSLINKKECGKHFKTILEILDKVDKENI